MIPPRATVKFKAGKIMRQRVEKLLPQLDQQPPTATCLRQLRALHVLEWIGNAEARALLAELASGEPAASLTRQALAVKQRLIK